MPIRALVVALLLMLAAADQARGQLDPEFDGVWDGAIDVVAVYGLRRPSAVLPGHESPVPLQIRVRGQAVTVWSGNQRLRPVSGFRIEKHDAAAVIVAAAETTTWIETWQISVTKTETDKLLVYLWRVVNNTQLHPNRDGSRFAWGGVGELVRSGSAE